MHTNYHTLEFRIPAPWITVNTNKNWEQDACIWKRKEYVILLSKTIFDNHEIVFIPTASANTSSTKENWLNNIKSVLDGFIMKTQGGMKMAYSAQVLAFRLAGETIRIHKKFANIIKNYTINYDNRMLAKENLSSKCNIVSTAHHYCCIGRSIGFGLERLHFFTLSIIEIFTHCWSDIVSQFPSRTHELGR